MRIESYINILDTPGMIKDAEPIHEGVFPDWDFWETQKVVKHKGFDYEGIVDAVVSIKGNLYIVHVSEVTPEDLMYTAACAKAMEEDIEGRIILSGETLIFVDEDNDTMESDFNAFLSCYYLYGWLEESYDKKRDKKIR